MLKKKNIGCIHNCFPTVNWTLSFSHRVLGSAELDRILGSVELVAEQICLRSIYSVSSRRFFPDTKTKRFFSSIPRSIALSSSYIVAVLKLHI
ncbi:hypothetical protein PUN28_006318 [Cardiocondyla obscurior]|uniref:Uncharacterized protein n=1 Tax=Cardiocondyla obscurior TaxID=286306 RepID=A0AAW2GAN5_9HYME